MITGATNVPPFPGERDSICRWMRLAEFRLQSLDCLRPLIGKSWFQLLGSFEFRARKIGFSFARVQLRLTK